MKHLTANQKLLLRIAGFILGFAIGLFAVFQVLFLIKVIPHGGI